jgi:hypothetical protein
MPTVHKQLEVELFDFRLFSVPWSYPLLSIPFVISNANIPRLPTEMTAVVLTLIWT